jgi:NifU-like protein involved in Fe-S cluster formation
MYNTIIIENFTNPRHSGELRSPDFFIELGDPVCGDKMIVQGMLSDDKVVTKAKFQAWGCATSVAAANIFCRFLLNRPLSEVEDTPKEKIDSLLGDLDPSQYHCLEMLRELFQNTKKINLEIE